jgi:hypothetical protein
VFDLSSEVLDKVTDGRQQPRTPTTLILKSALAMFWARLGSLNALETISTARFWKRWLGGAMTSADTMGRVHTVVDAGQLRDGLHQVYSCLKRNKALPLNLGLDVAVLDGHEQHASYRRPCAGCRQRTVKTEQGERIQYYHRQVTLMLLPGTRGRPPHASSPGAIKDGTLKTSALMNWSMAGKPITFTGTMPRPSRHFLLIAFLAYNIFPAFIGLNLKPQLRDSKPEKYWPCLIAAELYSDAGTTPKRAP